MIKKINKFNFIEIVPSRYDKSPILISLLWKERILEFGPNDSIPSFLTFIDKETSLKQGNLIIYTPNLEFLFETLLLLKTGSHDEIKVLAFKNTIYSVKIPIKKTTLHFKNVNTFIKDPLEKLKNYDIIGYYPGTKAKEEVRESYTEENNENKDWRNLLIFLKPNHIKNISYVSSFYSDERIDSHEEIEARKKELPLKIQKNLKTLQDYFTQIDKLLSIFSKNWYYNYSIASISTEIFIKNFNTFGIEFKTSIEEDKNIRPSFIGGRCEVFGNPYENEVVYHYDFESMYGQVMEENFPTGDLEKLEHLETIDKSGFYYVTVSSQKMAIPILPFRDSLEGQKIVWEEELDQKIFFPNGTFSGIYYNEELLLFLKEGGKILKIHYGFIFKGSKKSIFKSFSKNLTELKRNQKSKIWKSLIVSFYGRLGMSVQNTKIIIGEKINYKEKTKDFEIIREVWFGDFFLIEVKTEEKTELNSKVAYASIITSKARIKLWKNLKEIENNKGRILYCDTDSIFAAFSSKDQIIGHKMGDILWSKDSKIDNSAFAGQKSYSLKIKNNWETKIVGLPRNSINFEEFKENFYMNTLNKYKIKNIKRDIFKSEIWHTVSIINLNNYNKRIFTIDKKKTIPLYKSGNEYLIKDPFF